MLLLFENLNSRDAKRELPNCLDPPCGMNWMTVGPMKSEK
jgi:hypothetical protein